MTETERIDNIVEDLTQSAAADALLGACVTCSHRGCERKRQAERDTQIAGQELAAYIATLRAQLATERRTITREEFDNAVARFAWVANAADEMHAIAAAWRLTVEDA